LIFRCLTRNGNSGDVIAFAGTTTGATRQRFVAAALNDDSTRRKQHERFDALEPAQGPGRGCGISSGHAGFQGGVTEPVLLWKSEPEYSEEARKAKIQGTVIVSAEIDARGQVQNISIAQGLGLGLDEKAISAVQKWKFRPGTRNGKPVATPAIIQLSFRLL